MSGPMEGRSPIGCETAPCRATARGHGTGWTSSSTGWLKAGLNDPLPVQPVLRTMTVHTVASTTETVRSGYLDPAAPPVATIEPGDVVSYPDTWTHWGNEATFGMTFAEREPLRHRYPNG